MRTALRATAARLRTREEGMTTAEYAVGTVAACGFGGVLYKVVTSTEVMNVIGKLILTALKHFL